jgi:hypothetical protein
VGGIADRAVAGLVAVGNAALTCARRFCIRPPWVSCQNAPLQPITIHCVTDEFQVRNSRVSVS